MLTPAAWIPQIGNQDDHDMKRMRSVFVMLAAALIALFFFFNPLMSTLGGLLAHGEAKRVVLAYPAKLRREFERKKLRYVPYAEIPVCARRGIVSVEDKRFFTDSGIDPVAILRVIAMSVVNDHTDHGGSTLTQQLARIVIREPRNEPSVWAEIRGLTRIMGYALIIDHEYSKAEILELYLNSVYYGRRAQGIAQAAEAYFRAPLERLSLGQCLYLTGLPQAPSAFGRDPSGAFAMRRYRHVLATMVRNHYLPAVVARVLEREDLFERVASEVHRGGARAGRR